jgi:hypothetical protein
VIRAFMEGPRMVGELDESTPSDGGADDEQTEPE